MGITFSVQSGERTIGGIRERICDANLQEPSAIRPTHCCGLARVDVEVPVGADVPDEQARAAIGGCVSTAGGWAVGCKVEIVDLISSASFVIDYRADGVGQVRDMRGETCANTLGTCSVSGGIKRATESSEGPAWAELGYSAQAGPATVNGAFGVRVTGSHVEAY